MYIFLVYELGQKIQSNSLPPEVPLICHNYLLNT